MAARGLTAPTFPQLQSAFQNEARDTYGLTKSELSQLREHSLQARTTAHCTVAHSVL